MSTPESPFNPPCSNWISAEDVAAACDALDSSGDPSVYDDAARQASEILWAASGRQFSGSCTDTVRPCVRDCGCWGPWAGGYGFSWDYGGLWIAGGGDGVSAVQGWVGGGGCYQNGCCGSLSRVKLSGYPVTEIVEVTIGGDVIPAEDYRLDGNKWLTYLDDTDGNKRRWPACQNLAVGDDEPGAFTVTYMHGIPPPQIGLDAAVQLACHIAALGGECELPPGTTRIDRQGVQIELAPSWRGGLPPSFAALPLVQLFLAAVNPNGLRRRSAVWSPDMEPYALRYGP